jgi:recombination protein RecT
METPTTQLTIKNLFQKDEVRNKFQEMLGKRAPAFITSVLQIVSSNKLLLNADPHSVYHSAAVAATLDLPLNNNLGFAYIVAYNESYQEDGAWKKRQVAQFQMGYKGYIQLAQRSGQFKTLNAVDVREGELKMENKLTGEYVFEWIQDEEIRLTKKVIGFVSYFKLVNGFEKIMYMSIKKLNEHGIKYSQTFKNGKGRWKDDFDAMALKTVIKLNISKYAPLSVEMQKAITFDQAVIKDAETQDVTYADNQDVIESHTVEELQLLLDEKIALLNKTDFDAAKRIITNKEENSYNKLYTTLTNLTDVENTDNKN